MSSESFNLFVRSREGILYQGDVKSVSSVNDQGKFDILPQHANFISLIKKILVIRELNGGVKEIKIINGIMRVIDKKVEIYLGIEEAIKTVSE